VCVPWPTATFIIIINGSNIINNFWAISIGFYLNLNAVLLLFNNMVLIMKMQFLFNNMVLTI
jgi:hypothetical protein